MPEPDNPKDEVFYGERDWHFPHGLNIKGSMLFDASKQTLPINSIPVGYYWSPPGFSSTLSHVSTVDNRAFLSYFDNSEPFTIDEIAVEVLTTPGTAGALLRPCLYLDDGTLLRPGARILDAAAVSGEAIALLTQAVNVVVPVGRIWYGGAYQGTPTTRPTTRASLPITPQGLPNALSTANTVPCACEFFNGISGQFPANMPAPNGYTSITMAVRLRRSA